MNIQTQRVRVSLCFLNGPDADILSRAQAVIKGMTGNPAFTQPPTDPAVLETLLGNYSAAIAAAAGGDTAAIADSRRQRQAAGKMLRLLGHYAETACNNDLTTLRTSGFEPLILGGSPFPQSASSASRKIVQEKCDKKPVCALLSNEGREQIDTLYRETHRLVYRSAMRITGNHEDAEDARQNVYLQLMQSGETSLDSCENPKGYLHQAAIHAALRVVEERKRPGLTSDKVEFDQLPAPAAESDFELREWLQTALAKLKPEVADILLLHYEQGLTGEEIASMLGRSLSNVMMILQRGKISLKKQLRRCGGKT